MDTSIFKAYDVRGLYPQELNEADRARHRPRLRRLPAGARRIGVSRDMRVSSPALAEAFIDGALTQGADVVDLGMLGTDQMYFGVVQQAASTAARRSPRRTTRGDTTA